MASHGMGTKIYYLGLLRASEGTLSRWSRLHLQSLAPTPDSRRVDVRQAAGSKNIIAESLSQHNEKHVVPTPLSGIRVGGRKNLGTPLQREEFIIHTYIPLTIYPRRGSRGISNIPPRYPRFTKISYVEHCRRDRW
jgi:hypothetical protein